jgi:tetratricopeptide (TPR) repeat protein
LVAVVLICAGSPARALADEAIERAKKHLAKATEFFHQGKYEQSAEEYQKAYEAKAVPDFLYNIGQCHKNLGGVEHLEKAVSYIESYLEMYRKASRVPPDQKEVEAEIAQLKQQIENLRQAEQKKPAPEPEKPEPAVDVPAADFSIPDEEPAPAPSPFYKKWWFWTAVGAVVAGGVVAVLLTTGGDDRVPVGPNREFSPSSLGQ